MREKRTTTLQGRLFVYILLCQPEQARAVVRKKKPITIAGIHFQSSRYLRSNNFAIRAYQHAIIDIYQRRNPESFMLLSRSEQLCEESAGLICCNLF
jgi:hypothetical protein